MAPERVAAREFSGASFLEALRCAPVSFQLWHD
jgi:hypothetical protein